MLQRRVFANHAAAVRSMAPYSVELLRTLAVLVSPPPLQEQAGKLAATFEPVALALWVVQSIAAYHQGYAQGQDDYHRGKYWHAELERERGGAAALPSELRR
jgi:hypothetical protein